MINKNNINTILLVILIILVGVLIFVVVNKKDVKEGTDNIIEDNASLFTYGNVDLGFEFKYPKQYGKLNLSVNPGETGTIFYATTPEYNIQFGGITTDFSEGREGVPFDFSGDDEILSRLKDRAGFIYTYEDFETSNGDRGARVEYIAVDPSDELGSSPPPGSVLYYFKLNAMFPGVVFMFDKNQTPDHEEIMKSLEIN